MGLGERGRSGRGHRPCSPLMSWPHHHVVLAAHFMGRFGPPCDVRSGLIITKQTQRDNRCSCPTVDDDIEAFLSHMATRNSNLLRSVHLYLFVLLTLVFLFRVIDKGHYDTAPISSEISESPAQALVNGLLGLQRVNVLGVAAEGNKMEPCCLGRSRQRSCCKRYMVIRSMSYG